MNASILIKFEFSREILVWAVYSFYRYHAGPRTFFKKQIIQLIRTEVELHGCHESHWLKLISDMEKEVSQESVFAWLKVQAEKTVEQKWPKFPDCKLH